MPQVKIEKSASYTVIANDVLQNPELSLKAKGLLLYMLSLPADWDYSIGGLSSKCKEGAAAIRSAIQELIDAGHIVRRQVQDERGKWDGYEYTVFECAQSPSCENPTTDFTTTENRTEQNNNNTKQELNKPPIVPQAGRGISKPKWHPEWFETFWNFYPVHKGRQDACRAWDKLKPDYDFCRLMCEALRAQKRSDQWKRDNGAYIPHCSRWLNGRKWEDEERLPPPGDLSGRWADDPEVTD